MRHGHIERLILGFLEEPASEELICQVHAPKRNRPRYEYKELHKIRGILDRMVDKGLIEKQGKVYRRKS